jgi:hypothetical protein
MLRKIIVRTLIVLAVLLILAQLVPIPRENPPVEEEPVMSAEVRAILVKACYDCHSNETRWPWYSRVAPMSWLVAYDVRKGREELNFSEWNRMAPKDRAEAREEVWEEVEEGEMPPWFYLPAHAEARLTPAEMALLREWAGIRKPQDD